MSEPVKPRLRGDLEILVAEAEGEDLLVLRDPRALVAEVAQFGLGLLPILQYFDGAHTLEEIRTDLARRGAGFVPVEQIRAVVEALDRGLLLDSDRLRAEERARAAFLQAGIRPAAHAGQAYPEEPAAARAFLQEMLELAPEPAPPPAPLRRLIAPHIDLNLGREVYAYAHRRLAAGGRPDAVVILGVRHDAGTRRFVACRKDFATPLGTVRHDAALLDALEERLGTDLTQEQLAHRSEHSVEFQALWLAHHWPDDPPGIVPMLVGSFQDFIEGNRPPGGDGEVEAFVQALGAAMRSDGRRVVLVASVDLAHMGPIYDQPDGLDEEGEARLEREDLAILSRVEAGDAEGFFAAIAAERNARNVCGVAPIYLTLRLGEGTGELLKYGQGRIHAETGSVVSFAALAFAR